MKEGVQTEFKSVLHKPGPLNMTGASGIKVSANGEWLMTLPLADGIFQAANSLPVNQVT